MAIDRVLSADSRGPQEEALNVSLRPQKLGECVGQQNAKDKLSIAIAAAKKRVVAANAAANLRRSLGRLDDAQESSPFLAPSAAGNSEP